MKRIYLSLGSNIGDRVGHIHKAFERLAAAGIRIRRASSYYKTEPLDFRLQSWFVNCVAEVESDLMPVRLLRVCKAIERELGRRPGVQKGPRTIDIDILLYENAVVRSRDLVIPHERMTERRFVLVPLMELAPNLRHPVSSLSLPELLHQTSDSGRVIRMGTA
ncbi:MAG TPA: 2-amino-4-hydroxy-6-hydroxymethyldihydropteridine diphosphokinase [Terriglobia bacterium]|nr:2-amino-4-hydroxy-6-hydroxymethyldihydropteridine diphosphokinase [Terriglobia bacterium]